MLIAKVVGYARWITAGATALGLMVVDGGLLDPDGFEKVGPSRCWRGDVPPELLNKAAA